MSWTVEGLTSADLAASAGAIGRDIMVNAIYCGGLNDSDAESWRQVARLADGQFAAIDHQHGTVVVQTPFDAKLTELSAELNGTYLAFGARAAWAGENQLRQDANAIGLNFEAAAARAFCKANTLYDNSSWDLVDAVRQQKLVLAELAEEDLPEAMQMMTVDERKSHVAAMGKNRGAIQKEINDLSLRRRQFIGEERQRQDLDTSNSFDDAMSRAIRSQAVTKGYRFKKQERN